MLLGGYRLAQADSHSAARNGGLEHLFLKMFPDLHAAVTDA
jgi:hypothetical protein